MHQVPTRFLCCLIFCFAGYASYVFVGPISVFGEDTKSQASAPPKIDHILLEVSIREPLESKHNCGLARRPEHELLPTSSDELFVGAAHSGSCASGNTLAPAGITYGLYFQGCADKEWLPPIKIGNVTSSQRASA